MKLMVWRLDSKSLKKCTKDDKQSFPFNEFLARKEFENANACKHKSFLTNKSKEELFVFSNALKTRQLVMFTKNSLFFQTFKYYKNKLFSKRDFLFFIKHSKLWKNLILRSINYKKLFEVKSYKIYFQGCFT